MKHLHTEGPCRTCALCGSPMRPYTDHIKFLLKCTNKDCGYSYQTTGSIADQRKFDFKVKIVQAVLQKAGYYELYQPLEELLYNDLIRLGKDPEKAVEEVIRDLKMSEQEAEYFRNKIRNLG